MNESIDNNYEYHYNITHCFYFLVNTQSHFCHIYYIHVPFEVIQHVISGDIVLDLVSSLEHDTLR